MATQLPPSNDLRATWSFLENGIDAMMTRLLEGMSYNQYMSLYTVAYNYCISSRMHATAQPLGTASQGRAGANLMGSDLYNHLVKYFQEHLWQVRKESEQYIDEPLLKFYAREWERYTNGANYVHRLFTYLNRHWVKREKDEGRRNVYNVYTLALVQWKKELFAHVQSKGKLITALLKQIEKQRNGEVIETVLVKKIVDSLVALGLDEQDTNKQNLDVYRDEFELPFIAATEMYYKSESETFVAANSVTDYMKKAESRLKEEEDRVELYLNPSTRRALIATCESVLVRGQTKIIWDEFQNLLDLEKEGDLHRMYTLLGRIPEGLEPMRQIFEEHVKQAGLAAIEKVAAAGESLEPSAYVEALLEVHKKSSETVARAFRGEPGFIAALDRACREFVNKNKATGKSSSKSPEYLARHVNNLLSKANKNSEEADLEEALNQAMVVFKYIEDKDVFQSYYRKQLCNRLIKFTSTSDDAEASMIAKLKEACGFEYTGKLQRMFTDMSLSKDLNDQFRERMEMTHGKEDLDVDFYALVLGTSSWPLTPPTTNFTIPTELLPTYQRFQGYYNNKHSGRKLTWLWGQSKNEMRTNYLSTKYIFLTSTFQMAVLLQYNDADSFTFKDLQTATGLNDETLRGVLQVLVKFKVLLQDGDSYDLNMDFKSKKVRVNLNVQIRAEAKAESADVMKTVDEDRKLLLQATIVRIMKARKQLKHQTLIQEVITILQSRFQPRVPDIKKAIDQLIDKEYLERVEGQKDVYSYLA